jgi:hypothetical protein
MLQRLRMLILQSLLLIRADGVSSHLLVSTQDHLSSIDGYSTFSFQWNIDSVREGRKWDDWDGVPSSDLVGRRGK